MSLRTALRRTLAALSVACLASFSTNAAAEDSAAIREAAKHFQHGVALYGEADYRAALVEFKRACALAPNATVLYNIGETEYQLQDYAGALATFERYLTEAGAGEGHRAEVESDIDVLRARVGHVTVTTTTPGADIAVDDQAVGRTPIDKPVLVSIGRRKMTASFPGRPPVTRYVDVAADDNVAVALQPPSAPSESAPAGSATVPRDVEMPGAFEREVAPSGHDGRFWRVLGWSTTGTAAAGAIAFGILALSESSTLKSARAAYPTPPETLDHDSAMTKTYSIIADSLAATALVVGSITLVSTMSASGSSNGPSQGKRAGARVTLGPAAARFEATF